MKSSVVLIAILYLFIVGCEKENYCDSLSPPSIEAVFTIEDQNTGKSLIGSDRQYNPDSLVSLNPNLPVHRFNSIDTVISYSFGKLPSGSSQAFKLSENEIDTLKVDYFIRQTECFSIKTDSELYYNGIPIQKKSGIYVVLK